MTISNGCVAGISPHTNKSSGTDGDLDDAAGKDDEEAGEDATVRTKCVRGENSTV